MRTSRILTFLSLLALLFTFTSLSGSVKAAGRQADAPPITGTLVATPENTLPTMLFLQVGSQTILVTVTASTHIERHDGGSATLSDLHDGDQLQVTGSPNTSGGITASLIMDLSLGSVPPPGPLKVNGVVGVTPSITSLPVTLCVMNAHLQSNALVPNVSTVSPCPTGQLPVVVTGSTPIYRADLSRAAPFELRAGDSLSITGTFVNASFTASWIKDASLFQTFTQFAGTALNVVQDSANSTITDVTASVDRLRFANSPVPLGAQLVLPITDSSSKSCQSPSSLLPPCTRVSINGAVSNGYTGTGINVSDKVVVWGVYNNQLKQFEYVKTFNVTTPTIRVVGNLAAIQGAVLCLSNAQVQNAAPRPQVSPVSPCANGWLPVYVTGNTRYLTVDDSPSSLGQLLVGDRLVVSGSFIAAQFTAQGVRDLSRHANAITIVGKVQYVSFASTPPYFTILVQKVDGNPGSSLDGKALTVDVSASTKIMIGNSVTNDITVLNPGQRVRVTGFYDSNAQAFTPTLQVNVL